MSGREAEWISVILAGGQSRRMGRSKALLAWDERLLLERTVERLRPFSKAIVIAVNEADYPQLERIWRGDGCVQLLLDAPLYRGCGPMAGLYTAMEACGRGLYFVWTCDMPELDSGYMRGLRMCRQADPGFDAWLPTDDGRIQLLAGLYRNCREELGRLLDRGEYSMHSLLDSLRPRLIHPEEWRRWTAVGEPFFNMNHPHEYASWRKGQVENYAERS